MDQHYGYIDANRAYTLTGLGCIVQFASNNKERQRVKHSTVREYLRSIGVPATTFGQTAIIPGPLIILALERRAEKMDMEDDVTEQSSKD